MGRETMDNQNTAVTKAGLEGSLYHMAAKLLVAAETDPQAAHSMRSVAAALEVIASKIGANPQQQPRLGEYRPAH